MLTLNQNLKKLVSLAQKPVKLGIGLMSGTSLDGLDIALCEFTGNGLSTKFKLIKYATIPYEDAFKDEIRSVFSKRSVDLEKVCLLNDFIGTFHGELILKTLIDWNINATSIDFIASHGQTIYHAPKRLHQQFGYPNATLQIGDGDHLAVKTGIITISDFRQKHIAAGGEGAPLALYGDVLLGSKPGESRILLNIGGIANLTYLPADSNMNRVLCTDVGPGNTLIDAACKKYFNQPYDEDGKIALAGSINEQLLNELLKHPFFNEVAPKTTGPELFNLAYVDKTLQALNINITTTDLIRTLTAYSAKAITNFIKNAFPVERIKLFVSGGGASNPTLIGFIKQELPQITVSDTSFLGINPDAKEAILFALLGNEALAGEPIAIGSNPAVLMGKFSFPA